MTPAVLAMSLLKKCAEAIPEGDMRHIGAVLSEKQKMLDHAICLLEDSDVTGKRNWDHIHPYNEPTKQALRALTWLISAMQFRQIFSSDRDNDAIRANPNFERQIREAISIENNLRDGILIVSYVERNSRKTTGRKGG